MSLRAGVYAPVGEPKEGSIHGNGHHGCCPEDRSTSASRENDGVEIAPCGVPETSVIGSGGFCSTSPSRPIGPAAVWAWSSAASAVIISALVHASLRNVSGGRRYPPGSRTFAFGRAPASRSAFFLFPVRPLGRTARVLAVIIVRSFLLDSARSTSMTRPTRNATQRSL